MTDTLASEEKTNNAEAAAENIQVEKKAKETETETEEAPTMVTRFKVIKMLRRPD